MLQQFINDHFFIIIAVTIILLLFLKPSKPSQKSIRNAYLNYDEFVSDYNILVMQAKRLMIEIEGKRFQIEIADSITAYSDKFHINANQILLLTDAMRGNIERQELSSFRKNLKQAVIYLEEIKEIYTILEKMNGSGITQEEYENIKREQQWEEEKREEEKRKEEQQSHKYNKSNIETGIQNTFFSGCNTKEQAEKRYRSLCKIYHPDNGGDTKTFQRINAEYKKVKGGFDE